MYGIYAQVYFCTPDDVNFVLRDSGLYSDPPTHTDARNLERIGARNIECTYASRNSGVLRPEIMYSGVFRPEIMYSGVLRPEIMYSGVLRPEIMYSGVLRPEIMNSGVFSGYNSKKLELLGLLRHIVSNMSLILV